jgi:hypothetical protein
MSLKNLMKRDDERRKPNSCSLCSSRACLYLTTILIAINLIRQALSVSSGLSSIRKTPSYNEKQTTATKNITKIQKITMDLEEIDKSTDNAQQQYRYYIYESSNLTLPKVRQKVFDPSAKAGGWGRQQWAKRFKPYAQGELRFHQSLEEHKLRTRNMSEAAFIVVPIPLGPAMFWGERADVDKAFSHLFDNEPHFRSHPEKHVFITNNERLFRSDPPSFNHFEQAFGFTLKRLKMMSRSVLVKDVDINFYDYGIKNAQRQGEWVSSHPLFEHSWSLGYSHEASDPDFKFEMVNFDSWNNKTFHFFFHATDREFMNNSTIYRHALVVDSPKNRRNITSQKEQLIQPSSVGYDIPLDQWISDYANSKFCLIIRGDNPGSRAFCRTIRQGCMPVIVSDMLPYFQPMFRSTLLKLEDFAVVVSERDFLDSPAQTLNRATTTDLSEQELRSKLEGLALVQRMLVLDHPASLFVPAFAKETLASQQSSYYDFENITV